MTKATAGERFVAKWLATTPHRIRAFKMFSTAKRDAYAIDRLLARERAKVAEDVLAMVANTPPNVTFDKIAEEVRAKYGKGKR